MNFDKIKQAHPYYREHYTLPINIPTDGLLPSDVFHSLCKGEFMDLLELEKSFNAKIIKSKNAKVAAEKSFLHAIGLANLSRHIYWKGYSIEFPAVYKKTIYSYLNDALKTLNQKEYIIAAIQLLFRIGDIEHAFELIANNKKLVFTSPVVCKIVFFTCIIEKDYTEAKKLAAFLINNPELYRSDWLATTALTCVLYKNGTLSNNFIDFTSLTENNAPVKHNIDIVTDKHTHKPKPKPKPKTTVVTCCDENYFFTHAIDLCFSVYETNRENLNFHFHIYNINDNISEEINKIIHRFPDMEISFSSEQVPSDMATRTFYASQRYIFAEYALAAFNTPILVVDADCLFRHSWKNISHLTQNQDLLYSFIEGTPFWEDVPACFVWYGGGETSKFFSNITARFIKKNLDNGNHRWFLDQIALAVAADACKDKEDVFPVHTSLVSSHNHQEGALTWVITTVKNSKGKYHDYKSELRKKYGYPCEESTEK